MKSELKHLPESEVEITGEIPAPEVGTYREQALAALGARVSIPGFRAGKAPRAMLEERIAPGELAQETAGRAIRAVFPELITTHRIRPLGEPDARIEHMEQGQPLRFSLRISVMPEFALPDYRRIATDVGKEPTDSTDISDQELRDAIKEIQKGLAAKGGAPSVTAEKESQELTDEEVRAMGPYENVDDFKKKLRDGMAHEKKERSRAKKRARLVDKLIAQAKFEPPRIFVDSELDSLIARLEEDVKRMGGALAEYLKQTGKTLEELRTEWRPAAAKRAAAGILLMQIAEKERISADESEVRREAEHIAAHRPGVSAERARAYVSHILTREKVFSFLEGTEGAPERGADS